MTTQAIEKINQEFPIRLADLAEDDETFRALAIEILHEHNLTNIREFHSLTEYRDALNENPHILPQIAIVDYLPQTLKEMNGVDITVMLMEKAHQQKLSWKPFVIIVTGMRNLEKEVVRFFRAGGGDWIYKHDPDFRAQYVAAVIKGATYTIGALEDKQFYQTLLDEDNDDDV